MRAKKAMSPLIATVLLIAFAVALGAMIMNWSSGTVSGPAVSTGDACEQVQIELNQVFGKELFCYQDGNIRFNIINTGSREIQGIQVRTVDANLDELKDDLANSDIPVGETFEADVPFDKSGKIHVELVPRLFVNNEAKYCVNKRIVQDILPDCSN